MTRRGADSQPRLAARWARVSSQFGLKNGCQSQSSFCAEQSPAALGAVSGPRLAWFASALAASGQSSLHARVGAADEGRTPSASSAAAGGLSTQAGMIGMARPAHCTAGVLVSRA